MVGGSLLASAYLIWTRHTLAPLVSLVSGCILISWIVVEAAMVRDGRALQATVFGLALHTIGMAWRFRQSAAA